MEEEKVSDFSDDYINYDDEEREQIEFEEKLVNIISISIFVGIIAVIIWSICSGFVVF